MLSDMYVLCGVENLPIRNEAGILANIQLVFARNT